jgi:hypothetical protein
MAESADQDRLRRYWERHSRSYDRDMRFLDRIAFGESRAWICYGRPVTFWRSQSVPA